MSPSMLQMAEGRAAAQLQMLRANATSRPRSTSTADPTESPAACCSLCGRRAGGSPGVRTALPRLHTVCRSYMLTQEKPPQEHGPPRGEAARHALRFRRKLLARPPARSPAPGSDHRGTVGRRPVSLSCFLPRRQEELISIHPPTFPEAPGVQTEARASALG